MSDELKNSEALCCPICGKPGGTVTVRESWIQAGGFGAVPRAAWVHISCDKKEQARLKSGKLKLHQLWVKRQSQAA